MPLGPVILRRRELAFCIAEPLAPLAEDEEFPDCPKLVPTRPATVCVRVSVFCVAAPPSDAAADADVPEFEKPTASDCEDALAMPGAARASADAPSTTDPRVIQLFAEFRSRCARPARAMVCSVLRSDFKPLNGQQLFEQQLLFLEYFEKTSLRDMRITHILILVHQKGDKDLMFCCRCWLMRCRSGAGSPRQHEPRSPQEVAAAD